MSKQQHTDGTFVAAFRASAPYIHAFRGRTFVIAFGGEALCDERFGSLVHDIALLSSLGIRLVLVHGARPQIEDALSEKRLSMEYAEGMRVTDTAALRCVKEAVGAVRVEIEAQLSMGLANSPMAGARIRVASGNFVTAKPVGVRNGIDFQHTGEVRRVDSEAIRQRLDDGAIVLLSPLGYSPTGEVFNLTGQEVATATASALQADKLIFLSETDSPRTVRKRQARQLTVREAEQLLKRKKGVTEENRALLRNAIRACQQRVTRTHILNRRADGALLLELFTRDGFGTMVTADIYEGMRRATIEDVGGILELIKPLEEEGILVKRSREQLELSIEHFMVIDRDGMIVACAAFFPFLDEHAGELACLAVHPDYRHDGRGDALLSYIERLAANERVTRLFVLTTRAIHWFRERGFSETDRRSLPMKRQALYNLQRNSKVLVKHITA